jgi:hypothetical protein
MGSLGLAPTLLANIRLGHKSLASLFTAPITIVKSRTVAHNPKIEGKERERNC